jgi:transcriptional regulator with XRE-family HTH domain
LTQPELAQLAGVSERTVRNVERGRGIRLDFLRYLAVVLGVDVLDVVQDRDQLRVALSDELKVRHILSAIDAFTKGADLTELYGLLSSNVFINVPGPVEIPYVGEYRGVDGFRTFLDRSSSTVAHEQPPKITDIKVAGNLVVMSGIDWHRAIPTGKTFSGAWMHVYEFEKGRILRFDNWGETNKVQVALQPG